MASTALANDPSVVLGPSYNLYQFNHNLFKIVHFKSPLVRVKGAHEVDRSVKGNERKLDQAIARAKRVVLEKALCNDWDWFGTFTLDKTKYDRNDLDKFYKDFTQFIRDQRKKTGAPLRYMLIPEMHKDGAWHMHGLLYGVPDTVSFRSMRDSGVFVPNKLVWNDYHNWPAFLDKFGFCSLGRIRSSEGSGFYITKYVGKALKDSSISVGRHLYYASVGLSRALLRGEVYGESSWLDQFTVNHYDFCDIGMARSDRGFDWDYAMDLAEVPGVASLESFLIEQLDESAAAYIDSHEQFWQMAFDDYFDSQERSSYEYEKAACSLGEEETAVSSGVCHR